MCTVFLSNIIIRGYYYHCNVRLVVSSLVSFSVFDWRRKQKLSNYIFRMNRYQNEVYPSLQRDSSDVTDLCSRQPSIDRNRHCGPKQAWYYYDGLKDVCVRIKGCYAPGAFFTRRKDCNKSCLKPRKVAGKFH